MIPAISITSMIRGGFGFAECLLAPRILALGQAATLFSWRHKWLWAVMPAYVEVWREKDACATRDMLNLQTRWSQKMDTSRRRLLAGVGGLSLGAAVSAVQPRQAIANETSTVAASEGGEELVAVAVNDALEGATRRKKKKSHEGARNYWLFCRDKGGGAALAISPVR
jgi:hypothetical protein